MLPTVYTVETLTLFMRDALAETGKGLAWGDDRFVEPIIATLLAYGVSDLTKATGIYRLRLLATIEAWRAVMNATAGDFDAGSQGDDLKRSQVHKQASAMFRLAQSAHAEWQEEQAVPDSSRFASSSTSVQVIW